MKLSQDELKKYLRYEPETGLFYWLVSKGGKKAGSVAGCVHRKKRRKSTRGVNLPLSYINIGLNGKGYSGHQLAFIYMTGVAPAEIDHADSDGTNNKWSNLSETNPSLNNLRSRYRCLNPSGFIGVKKHRKKWQAIVYNKVRIVIGSFETPENAKQARDEYFAKHGMELRVHREVR